MLGENSPQTKLFFSGSIRGGGEYAAHYRKILEFLRDFGEITSEHLGRKRAVDPHGATSDQDIYARDVRWIRESHVLIAEVSQPSTGVGYEIAYAEAFSKPVLALYCRNAEKSLSAMIAGNPHITTIEYETLDRLWPLLREALSVMVGRTC